MTNNIFEYIVVDFIFRFYFVKDISAVLKLALEKNIFNPVEENENPQDGGDSKNINKLSKL